MNRAVRIAAILVLLGIIALIWWAPGIDFSNGFHPPTALHQAIDHPMDFAKNHFTGGIGVLIGIDSRSGLAMIEGVLNGSPAHDAGLRERDVIIKVNGIATKGKSVTQVMEELRGIVGGEINLAIQREGTTNLEVTLHRRSWTKIGISPYSLPPGPPTLTVRTNFIMNLPSGHSTN